MEITEPNFYINSIQQNGTQYDMSGGKKSNFSLCNVKTQQLKMRGKFLRTINSNRNLVPFSLSAVIYKDQKILRSEANTSYCKGSKNTKIWLVFTTSVIIF